MPDEIIGFIDALTALMEEETAALMQHGPYREHREVVDAKLRLSTRLESLIVRLGRENPQWMDTLDAADRDRLVEALRGLSVAGAANERMLRRQIDLSNETIAAVASEVRRVSGSRTATYTASGHLARTEIATPISFNSGI